MRQHPPIRLAKVHTASIWIMILLVLTTFAGGCGSSGAAGVNAEGLDRFEYSRFLMGVQARIVLYAPDEAQARKAGIAAFERISDLDAIMSDYRPDSELMRLCDRAGTGPVEVSTDLFTVLTAASELNAESGGAFDITIGPIVQLWREARQERRLPRDAGLADALTRVGGHLMSLDDENRTVTLSEPGMRLDLGGIGKGYACDEAMRVLVAHNCPRSLIDIGGDLVAGEPPPGAKGWRVGVLTGDPTIDEDGGEPLLVKNAGVATSGDTTQFIEIDGIRYSHIVDPKTGLGLTNRVSVSVIAPSGMLADGLASALSVADSDFAPHLSRRYRGVWTRIITIPDRAGPGVDSNEPEPD